jgi:hypothetical protein
MQYEPLHKKHVLRLLRCARPPLGFRGQLRFTSSALLLLWYLETRFRFNCGTKQGRSPDASWVVVPNSCSHTPTTAGLVDIPSQTLMRPSPYHSVNEMPGGRNLRRFPWQYVTVTDDDVNHVRRKKNEDWTKTHKACACAQNSGWKTSVKKDNACQFIDIFTYL